MSSPHRLEFTFTDRQGSTRRETAIQRLVIAGWTGRDQAAMQAHIHELQAIGVPAPKTTPTYYRVSARRATTADHIEVSGGDSSGEVEFVLLNTRGQLWLGVGSDHTDRTVETYGITVSKQMCDKPLAARWWPLDEVLPHWGELQLRAHATIDGRAVLYQEGGVLAMRDPLELVERYQQRYGEFTDGSVMFCGTLAAIGGIRPAARFAIELRDPVLGRHIAHAYDIECLPIVERD